MTTQEQPSLAAGLFAAEVRLFKAEVDLAIRSGNAAQPLSC